MTKHARVNKDGAIELPEGVLDAVGWRPGTELVLEETPAGLTVRKSSADASVGSVTSEKISVEEFWRRVPPHKGAPATLEDMNRAVDAMIAQRWAEEDARIL